MNDAQKMHKACHDGDVGTVKSLLNKKSNIEARNEDDWRPIHTACKKGRVHIAKLLLGEKCDFEACDKDNWRPIHYACKKGNTDIAKLLLAEKCNIEACDKNGHRPIHIACYYENIDIVELLLEKKCDIEALDRKFRRPIHSACWGRNVNVVKLLIRAKCNIEARDRFEERPIHISCMNGDFDIFKLLVEEKCNIEAPDKIGWRPIHHACIHGNIEIVKLLLKRKCNIEAQDEKLRRPIHYACYNKRLEITKLLLGEKCDIEASCKYGWRAIHNACFGGSVDIVKLLLAENCNTEVRDESNRTPLSIAMQENNDELIRILGCQSPKNKLVQKIEQISKIKCNTLCNHKSCPRSLIPTDSQSKVIGSGGFGKVYKLTDPDTKFVYAVKSIELDQRDVNNDVKNLENDINKYRNIIKHPRIIEYFGSILYSSHIYIFMEFVAIGSLHDKIRRLGTLPHQKIICYAKQILEGLEFLHDKKVIHRDIKPQNILLDGNDNIKLCDFGLSKVLESISIYGKNQNANTVCGTLSYMAPEVISGNGYRFSADIWSVGATIIHMLTGQPPYSHLNQAEVIFKIGTTKKIEYQPRESMSYNMKLFMEEILKPDASKRANAKQLLHFLIDRNMI